MAPRGRPRGGAARRPRETGRAPAIVFRVAASPRIGFGHLVRALHLARAAGVSPRVSLRGPDAVRATAQRLGATLLAGHAAGVIRPGLALLVIDDPSRTAALPWLRAARRAGVRVASIHDVGVAPLPSDLAVDGSLGARRVRGLGLDARACRLGPAYAVLSPNLAGRRLQRPLRRRAGVRQSTIVVGLGGGRHARAGLVIARHLRTGLDCHPGLRRVRVLLSLGLSPGANANRLALPAGVSVVDPGRFRAALAAAAMAVVAGGTTLYEACALGTPVVAVPVVPGQVTAIRRFVRAGLAVGGDRSKAARVGSERWGRASAAAALALFADAKRRDEMGRRGRIAVDGRGALRVMQAIAELLDGEMSATRTTR